MLLNLGHEIFFSLFEDLNFPSVTSDFWEELKNNIISMSSFESSCILIYTLCTSVCVRSQSASVVVNLLLNECILFSDSKLMFVQV